ncbi:helix-turn-helix transcriptional regulator [Sphingomonas oleivorans]|uniref:Helix-turn-helix transcriptional regulator n=2 Tax=Sphingomonas oleivorans TaxID=1735121 RepID=A0A2T5G067_9SPHN|nr:helix-turn-helix transcriptional regulator [Sphingomonas oleivorans]
MMSERIPETPHLTERELLVLALVSKGYSAKEVAQELRIAPRTVEKHIDHVRLKIRARNRTHMVAQAISRGLLAE